ncbi:Toll/interleukin-1 receptor domain-containing protein [Tanacetum coccineum]
MERLVSTPDFNGLPRLQKLELINCKELEEIHPSLGNHRSLKSVYVSDCSKLRMFPTIVRMEQLESLHISYCDKNALLSSIGERCTDLINLSFPPCFNGLKCLKEFQGSKGPEKTPFRLPLTRSLRKLDLSYCYFEDGEIPSDIGELSNLQDLNLSYNNFSKLHFSLLQLTRLKLLNLRGCESLVKLPGLPPSIAIIIAYGCDKLTSIGDHVFRPKISHVFRPRFKKLQESMKNEPSTPYLGSKRHTMTPLRPRKALQEKLERATNFSRATFVARERTTSPFCTPTGAKASVGTNFTIFLWFDAESIAELTTGEKGDVNKRCAIVCSGGEHSRWKDSNTPGKKGFLRSVAFTFPIHSLDYTFDTKSYSHCKRNDLAMLLEKCYGGPGWLLMISIHSATLVSLTACGQGYCNMTNCLLWLCMKESFFMLMLLIPGPKSPGKDIDVYLRPLIDDLKDLWVKPVNFRTRNEEAFPNTSGLGSRSNDPCVSEEQQSYSLCLWTITNSSQSNSFAIIVVRCQRIAHGVMAETVAEIDLLPSNHIPTCCVGCLGNRSVRGTRKPNLGRRKAGRLHTRQETRNHRDQFDMRTPQESDRWSTYLCDTSTSTKRSQCKKAALNLLLLCKDYDCSRHLNIYEMKNGNSEWLVKYFVNLDDMMRLFPTTTRKTRTGNELFPGDICRPGKVAKRQKSIRRGTNSDRLFSQSHAPLMLVERVADYTKLKAGYAQEGFAKPGLLAD